MSNDIRMAGNYKILHAFEIGHKKFVVGEDLTASPDERYVIADYENNGLFERYVNALVSNDYAEVAKIFAQRISNEAERVIDEKSNIDFDISPLSIENCTAVDYKDSIKNKVIVLRAEIFKPEYQIATSQLQLCTGGFGAEGNSRGSACFCTNLFSGKENRYERQDVLGIVDKEQLPQWAKERLQHVQKDRVEKRRERDAR